MLQHARRGVNSAWALVPVMGIVAGLTLHADIRPSDWNAGDPNTCELLLNSLNHLGLGEEFTFVARGQPPGGTYVWSVAQPGNQLSPTVGFGPEFPVLAGESSIGLDDVRISVTYVAASGVHCQAETTLTIVDFRLESLEFTAPPLVTVCEDCRSYGLCPGFPVPHWLDLDLDGSATGPDEHQSPAAFVRGATVVLSNVRFDAKPVDLGQNAVLIRGVGPDGQVFEGLGGLADGTVTLYGELEASAPLPNAVWVYDTYDIEWSVALNNAEVYGAGTSHNTVYVTYQEPLGKRLLSYFEVGTRAAQGAATLDDVVAAVWADFADLHVANARGQVMGYYRDTLCALDCTVYRAQDLLLDLNGQCGAWQDLFIQCIRTQGIGGLETVTIEPISAYGFLVRDYEFDAGGGSSGCPDFPYRLDSPCGEPYWPDGSEVADLVGLPGQDEENPASYFARHFIVKLNGKYYDPSYGAGPFEGTLDEANLTWEQSGIAGYHDYCGDYHAARMDVYEELETRFDR